MADADTAAVLKATVKLLEAEGIDYMLIGGVAAGIWGEPRYTVDADFIVVLSHNQTGRRSSAPGRCPPSLRGH